jgi:hypothetical protein
MKFNKRMKSSKLYTARTEKGILSKKRQCLCFYKHYDENN